MDKREVFYRDGVRAFLADRDASILVCGGGIHDKTVLEELGYRNVTISNLDTRMTGNEYPPFQWRFENAEALSFDDGSFDYVVIHAAIHHASSPHRVLTEMYRVARKGFLAFESRDSALLRFLERLGVPQVYEHAAVYYNDCKFGGVNNTEIPNYVYRWTEREIEKTIRSYAPEFEHRFHYRYDSARPSTPELEKKGLVKKCVLKLASPFYALFAKLFPKQQNLFAFYVEKPVTPNSLLPWLVFDETNQAVKFNKVWGDERYKNGDASAERRKAD